MYFYWQAAHSHSQDLQRVSLLKFRHQGSVVCSNRSQSWLSKDCCGGHLCWRAGVRLQCWTLLLSSEKHPIQSHHLVPSLSLQGKLQLSSVLMSEESSPLSCWKKQKWEQDFTPTSHNCTDDMLLCASAVLALYTTARYTERILKTAKTFFSWIHCYNLLALFWYFCCNNLQLYTQFL